MIKRVLLIAWLLMMGNNLLASSSERSFKLIGVTGSGAKAPPAALSKLTAIRAGEDINWQVVSCGGTSGISTNFSLMGTACQTAAGKGNSTNFTLNEGYWQDFSQLCDCLPGDANGDGTINITDPVYIIQYIFAGGPAPVPYAICSGDANCDCVVNITDAVYLIAYIFGGGSPPCSCEDWLDSCGPPLRK